MAKIPWCDHIVLLPDKSQYIVGRIKCPHGDVILIYVQPDWKSCPICLAQRPAEVEEKRIITLDQ